MASPDLKFDEGLAMANDTPYGLAAYVYTQDLDTAMYAAARLEVGGVGINVNDVTDIRGLFGGRKASGIGQELGQAGLDSYRGGTGLARSRSR